VRPEDDAVDRYPLRSKEENVEENDSIDPTAQQSLFLGADDARLVVDFAVGPSGVGPAMGIGSGEFFPSAADADLDSNRTGAGDTGDQ
jgi:hypothetical protein